MGITKSLFCNSIEQINNAFDKTIAKIKSKLIEMV